MLPVSGNSSILADLNPFRMPLLWKLRCRHVVHSLPATQTPMELEAHAEPAAMQFLQFGLSCSLGEVSWATEVLTSTAGMTDANENETTKESLELP